MLPPRYSRKGLKGTNEADKHSRHAGDGVAVLGIDLRMQRQERRDQANAQTNDQGAESATPAKDNKYAELAKLPDFLACRRPARMAAPAARPAPPGRQAPPPAALHPPPPPTAKSPAVHPEYAKKFAAFQEANKGQAGINFVAVAENVRRSPAAWTQPYPIEFLFTPGRVTILIETYSMVRLYPGQQRS